MGSASVVRYSGICEKLVLSGTNEVVAGMSPLLSVKRKEAERTFVPQCRNMFV